MPQQAVAFVSLGGILVLALLAEWVAARTPVPRVTALLVIGVLVGPAGFDVLPPARDAWEPVATNLALAMVGFLLGREFERRRVHEHGRRIFLVAVVAALITATVTAVVVALAGADVRVALALGGIAAATAPAATMVVVRDQRAEGELTTTLLGLVAIDDAIAISLFSVLVAIGSIVTGQGGAAQLMVDAAREVGGGVLLGLALGFPAAMLARRVHREDPLLVEDFALVLLLVGLGTWLRVSFLLAAVVAGAVVVNRTRDRQAFEEMERVEWPFLAVFFILGGAALELGPVTRNALLIGAYVLSRSAGKIAGAWAAATMAGAGEKTRRWLGPALLPQAGVGLGLALLVRERLPELGAAVVPVTVVSTVLFELAGPLLTRIAIKRSGEAGHARHGDPGDADES